MITHAVPYVTAFFLLIGLRARAWTGPVGALELRQQLNHGKLERNSAGGHLVHREHAGHDGLGQRGDVEKRIGGNR